MNTVRKRCIECRRVRNGTVGKHERCDCGGMLAPIVWRNRKARRRVR